MRTGHKLNKLMAFIGDSLDEIVAYHPFSEKEIPVLIDKDVDCFYGTGINCVSVHDFNSLKVTHNYNLSKQGLVDKYGKFTEDAGVLFNGLNVLDQDTNKFILKMMSEENSLFCSFPYKNEFL